MWRLEMVASWIEHWIDGSCCFGEKKQCRRSDRATKATPAQKSTHKPKGPLVAHVVAWSGSTRRMPMPHRAARNQNETIYHCLFARLSSRALLLSFCFLCMWCCALQCTSTDKDDAVLKKMAQWFAGSFSHNTAHTLLCSPNILSRQTVNLDSSRLRVPYPATVARPHSTTP